MATETLKASDVGTLKVTTIAEEMATLDYKPADEKKWAAMPEKDQRAVLVRKRNEQEMNAAKKLVKAFQETEEFGALAGNIKAAIKRICGKPSALGNLSRRNPFLETITALFPKPKTTVSELDIFMKTKMGRGEFRKKVRENLASAAVDSRLWVEFVEEKESWILLAKGGDQPKGWLGKEITFKA